MRKKKKKKKDKMLSGLREGSLERRGSVGPRKPSISEYLANDRGARVNGGGRR